MCKLLQRHASQPDAVLPLNLKFLNVKTVDMSVERAMNVESVPNATLHQEASFRLQGEF
jgi:hypothetical protein